MTQFSWIPMYEELATALLGYEHRQAELIDLLRELKDAGLKVVKLDDQAATGEEPLGVMDPFTFFASFNRNTTDANRTGILTGLKRWFNLTSEVPTDFTGIPLADNMQSWFFPYARERKPDDISALWSLARQAVTGARTDIQAVTFERCMAIRSVKLAKLTIGLYWLQPKKFMPLDGNSRAYLLRRGVAVPGAVASWTQYQTILGETAKVAGEDYPTSLRPTSAPWSGSRSWHWRSRSWARRTYPGSSSTR